MPLLEPREEEVSLQRVRVPFTALLARPRIGWLAPARPAWSSLTSKTGAGRL